MVGAEGLAAMAISLALHLRIPDIAVTVCFFGDEEFFRDIIQSLLDTKGAIRLQAISVPGDGEDPISTELRFKASLVFDLCQLHEKVSMEHQYFSPDKHWLVPQNTLKSIPESLRFNSNFYIASSSSVDSMSIKEHYSVKGKPAENYLGTLSMGGELKVDIPERWERRRNLHGASLRTATIEWAQFIVLEQEEPLSFSGMLPDLMRPMSALCNFSIEWTTPEDKQYGVMVKGNC